MSLVGGNPDRGNDEEVTFGSDLKPWPKLNSWNGRKRIDSGIRNSSDFGKIKTRERW